MMPLADGGVYTSWFQFSKTRDSVLPTYFGHRYEQDLRAARNVTPYSNANVTGIRLAADGRNVDHLDVATLNGKHFKVKPRMVVLACGGMENARQHGLCRARLSLGEPVQDLWLIPACGREGSESVQQVPVFHRKSRLAGNPAVAFAPPRGEVALAYQC